VMPRDFSHQPAPKRSALLATPPLSPRLPMDAEDRGSAACRAPESAVGTIASPSARVSGAHCSRDYSPCSQASRVPRSHWAYR
jgi:hypothetical protein